MGKIIVVLVLVLIVLSGCDNIKEGNDYSLIINATVAYDKGKMEDWVKAIGDKYAITVLKDSGNYEDIPFGSTYATLLEKDGKVCKVLLKEYNGKVAYTPCDYIISKN